MELFRLFGSIAIDNTEANHAIDETASRAENSQGKVNKAFGVIGSAAVSAGKLFAGAGLVIGGSVLAITEGTREYRQEMGLLESAYATAGHSSEVAKSTYSDLNAVMGDSGAAVEAAQHLSLIADNEGELNDLTHTLTGVYAKFGASLPLEGLAEGINHTAELGEVQGSLADALEWSGITVDDFNAQLAECTTEEERQDLIMDTLRNTYSKSADQYKETNKDVMEARKAQEKLSDAFAELGKVFEPIMTAIKTKVAEAISVAVPKIQELIDKIKDAINWIKENESTIQTWVAVILGASIAIGTFLLIMNWGSIMTAAAKAISTVRNAILLFNAALLANPVGIVIAIIAGLVAAFIYLWNNVEPFRQFWIDLWANVQEATGTAVDWISEKFDQIVSFFKDNWQGIILFMMNPFAGAFKLLYDNFEGFRNFVDGFVKSIAKFFSDLWKKIQKTWSGTKDWFSNLFKNTLSGIKGVFGGIVSWFSKIATDVKNKFSNGISGIKGKASEIFGAVKDTIKEKIESARDIVDKAIKKIKGFFPLSIGKIFSNLKIPSISVSGGKAPFGIAGKGKLPSFDVKWNAQGGIFDKPTILPTLEGWQGFGEAGAEAITPIDTLLLFIKEAVKAENEPVMYYMKQIMSILAEYMPQLADKDSNILLDGNALVGRLAPRMDQELGFIASKKQRGNI